MKKRVQKTKEMGVRRSNGLPRHFPLGTQQWKTTKENSENVCSKYTHTKGSSSSTNENERVKIPRLPQNTHKHPLRTTAF